MILVVGHEKGGTGKTTLAVNLATMCALAGHDTLLVDTDQQESASTWSATRDESGRNPSITCTSKRGKVGFDIAKLRDKFAHIIVDAGGRDSIELRQSIAVCDRLIIPVRASQFDTWSMDAMVVLLESIEKHSGFRPNASVVLNATSTNRQVKEADETRDYLMDDDYSEHFDILTTAISDRIAFRRAARDGMGVVEMIGNNMDPKASGEMQRLYKEVFGGSFNLK